MKKTILVLALVSSLAFKSQAQDELKPFKVDVSVGYAIPGGKGAKGGVLFVVEPKYAVIPEASLGLRMETAIIARGYGNSQELESVSVKASGSYLVTGDYYFSDNYSARPFLGAGVGMFRIATAEVNDNGNSSGVDVSGWKFGGMIRGGVELSHFRLGLEYNLVSKSSYTGYDVNNNPTPMTSKNGYIGIKLGVCIGGGPL